MKAAGEKIDKLTQEVEKLKQQLVQKENQLEQTIKNFQEKEQIKHQECLELLTKKEQDWETKLKENLKKPPVVEIGTQTDLTAEQITQMEKDLENYRDLLYKGSLEIDRLEKELVEISKKKDELSTEEPSNESEEAVKKIFEFVFEDEDKKMTLNEKERFVEWLFKDMGEAVYKINNEEFKRPKLGEIRNIFSFSLNFISEKLIGKILLEKEQEKLNKITTKLTDLQTQYDMEVRSKEELVKEKSELNSNFYIIDSALGFSYENIREDRIRESIENLKKVRVGIFSFPYLIAKNLEEYCKEKFWWDKWIEQSGKDKSEYYRLNSDYPSWTSIDGHKMKPILTNLFRGINDGVDYKDRKEVKYSVSVSPSLDSMSEEGKNFSLNISRKLMIAFYRYYRDR